MRRKFLSLFFLSPLFSTFLFSQSGTFTISGYVQEAETAERLIGATIVAPKLKIGTTTNKQGFFSFTLPRAPSTLIISFVGFQPETIRLSGIRDSSLTVRLKLQLAGTEVEVSAERRSDQTTQISAIELPIAQIKQAPVLLGEADVFKVLQLLPGIKSGMEGNSNFYVRGGGSDQNLILLDEAPIYNPFHLLGFVSVFNPNTLKNVEIYKGGFPARYGGRLSSVLDITMKEGNLKKHKGEANIGVLSTNVALEGPIIKNRVSYLIGGRVSYLDLWLRNVDNNDPKKTRPSYGFQDINAKISADITIKDRVQFSAYSGKDLYELIENEYFGTFATPQNVSYQQKSALDWQNQMLGLSWGRVWHKKLFSRFKAYQVHYNVGAFASVEEGKKGQEIYSYSAFSFVSGIQERGVKLDGEYTPSSRHQFRFGASGKQYQFSPGASRLDVQGADIDAIDIVLTPNRVQLNSRGYTFYVEDEFRWNEAFRINGGVHVAFLNTADKEFLSIEPRVNARYAFPSFTLKAGYAKMQQPLHLVASSGLGLPTDLWFPATRNIVPQLSHQWNVALVKSLPALYTELSLDGYYKTMQNITEYKPNALVFFEFEKYWEDQLTQGKGTSYGLETLLHKKHGKLNGWIGYTFSRTTRQFAILNRGNAFPFRYDRTHDASFVLNYKLSGKIQAGIIWVYGTGNAITLAQSAFQGVGFGGVNPYLTLVDMGKINGHRLDAVHRLDLNLKYNLSPKQDKSGLVIGVYNAYNRKNPVYAYLSTQHSTLQFKQVALFPIVPYASIDLKF